MRVLSITLLCLWSLCGFARDIVVSGGEIYTGKGEKPGRGSIRIRDGKIIEIGRRVDASGSLVPSDELLLDASLDSLVMDIAEDVALA